MTPVTATCRGCRWLAVTLAIASAFVAGELIHMGERIDRAENLALSTSCAVLRKLHWDDPTSPDCAAPLREKP